METLLKIVLHTTNDRLRQDDIYLVYDKLLKIYKETCEQHRQ